MCDEENSITESMQRIIQKLPYLVEQISKSEIHTFFTEIQKERRIYLAGEGRSGLIAKAFASRLMQTGLDSYVVGETVTPALKKGDLVIIFSGSGETKSMLEVSKIAKSVGGILCLITSRDKSHIQEIADIVIHLPLDANSKKEDNTYGIRQLKGEYRSLSSSDYITSTLFGPASLIFADSVIAALMQKRNMDFEDIETVLPNKMPSL